MILNKVIPAALAIAGIYPANAQIAIGPIAGGHLAQYSERVNGSKWSTPQYQLTTNWRLGVAADVRLSSRWALQPSITYATMYAVRPKAVPKNSRIDPHALELPVSFAYKFNPAHNTVMFSAGPYAAYHIKTYETGPGYGPGSTGKMYPVLTRFNMGVNATAGYEWEDGWFLRGYFQRVLTNMYSNAIYENYPMTVHAPYLTNFNFGIRAGYFFKMRSKKSITANPSGSQ